MGEPTTEQLINQPAEFKIGEKTVFVEALPAGAVTIIIKKMIAKTETVDLDMLQQISKEKKDKSIYDLFKERIDKSIKQNLNIFQMILTPAAKWKEKRGNLKEADYPVTNEDLEWNTTDQLLLKIFEEWLARNPRFALEKKMTGAMAGQQT